MLSAELIDKMETRKQAIRAEWEGKKKYPGTNFHPNDPASKDRESRGEPAADDRVIGIQLRHDTVFAGEDATRCLECLRKSVDELQAAKMADVQSARPGDDSTVLREGKEYLEATPNGVLVVRNVQLSAILWAMERLGVFSVITGLD